MPLIDPYEQTSLVDPYEQQDTQEKGFLSNVGSDLKERWNTITSPELYQKSAGNPMLHGYNVAGQVAGGINDIIGHGLRSAYQSLVPQKAQESIASVGRDIAQSPAFQSTVQTLGEGWESLEEASPESAQFLKSSGNIGGLLPIGKGGQLGYRGAKAASKEGLNVAKDTAQFFNKVIPEPQSVIDQEIKKVVTENINKSIKTSTKGKQTLPLIQRYFDNAETGIKEIVSNKGSINLTNEVGDVVTGALPATRMQMAEAIHQTEKRLFQEYDSLMKSAGKKGVELDLEPIAKQLDEVLKNESLLKSKDGISTIAHAQELQEILRSGKKTMSPQAAQDWIANANNRLMNKNLNFLETSKAGVDAGVASMMRKQLDNLIESTEGAGYQAIKNRYGAVKSLREGTNKAAFASMSERNMPNFFDITSGTALVHGLIAMNPATIAGASFMEGLNAFRRKMFNPDTYVKKMFKDVDTLMTRNQFTPVSKTGQYLQGMPEPPITKQPLPRSPLMRPLKAIEPIGEVFPSEITSPILKNLSAQPKKPVPRLGYSNFDIGEVNTLRRAKQRLPQEVLERKTKYQRY
jgi:hypothetical protein